MGKATFKPDPIALGVLRKLRSAGFETYFCGGCVRDTLIGRVPVDWDIATAATPGETEALFSRTLVVGKSFGVIIVVEQGQNVEVATFRKEGTYSDGRHPDSVSFATVEEDVRRRDFTINALLYDPDKDVVIDHVGGREDIERGVVRTVGDAERRFSEDHLRMLRAVRFGAMREFKLERSTLETIIRMSGLVESVSQERIGTEITRMLTEGTARRAFELLDASGLLDQLLPTVAGMRGVEQPPEFHPEGDVWTHVVIMLGLLDQTIGQGCLPHGRTLTDFDREVLGYAVLLHDVGKPATFTRADRIRFNGHDTLGADMSDQILKQLKRPRKVMDAVRDLVGRHMFFANMPHLRKAKLLRVIREELFPLHLELHRIDCEGSNGFSESYNFGLNAWKEEQARPAPLIPLLTGRDVLALGFSPGPLIGKILHAIEDGQLEGTLTDRESALDMIKEKFGN
jgi:putative nucleotidyltransferase with HDIG domain